MVSVSDPSPITQFSLVVYYILLGTRRTSSTRCALHFPVTGFGVQDITTVRIVQIEQAFSAGYDPALELAARVAHPMADGTGIDELELSDVPWTAYLRRKEQSIIEKIIWGSETGHYFVLLGPKVCLLLVAATCILNAPKGSRERQYGFKCDAG